MVNYAGRGRGQRKRSGGGPQMYISIVKSGSSDKGLIKPSNRWFPFKIASAYLSQLYPIAK